MSLAKCHLPSLWSPQLPTTAAFQSHSVAFAVCISPGCGICTEWTRFIPGTACWCQWHGAGIKLGPKSHYMCVHHLIIRCWSGCPPAGVWNVGWCLGNPFRWIWKTFTGMGQGICIEGNIKTLPVTALYTRLFALLCGNGHFFPGIGIWKGCSGLKQLLTPTALPCLTAEWRVAC